MTRQAATPTPESTILLAQRIEGNLFAARTGLVGNMHEMVNTFNHNQARSQANKAYYDAKGETMPAAAWVLAGDAERKIRHSRQLRRNMARANPAATLSPLFDTHHIVARLHYHAARSRAIMFAWGIAINDAANGVFLPRNLFIKHILGADATAHQILHTANYYFEIQMRLGRVANDSQLAVREVLGEIKAELLAGTFAC
jgi:A nuclease family of the HNH/ENDO VII superfamily with conserved AHH